MINNFYPNVLKVQLTLYENTIYYLTSSSTSSRMSPFAPEGDFAETMAESVGAISLGFTALYHSPFCLYNIKDKKEGFAWVDGWAEKLIPVINK